MSTRCSNNINSRNNDCGTKELCSSEFNFGSDENPLLAHMYNVELDIQFMINFMMSLKLSQLNFVYSSDFTSNEIFMTRVAAK